jgi:hypothetical protein
MSPLVGIEKIIRQGSPAGSVPVLDGVPIPKHPLSMYYQLERAVLELTRQCFVYGLGKNAVRLGTTYPDFSEFIPARFLTVPLVQNSFYPIRLETVSDGAQLVSDRMNGGGTSRRERRSFVFVIILHR